MPAGLHWKALLPAVVRLGVASLLLFPGDLLAQCAMCWQALANSAEGASLIRGFQDGIVFLLVVPFLVVGTIGFLLYKAQRSRVSRDLAADGELSPPVPALASRSGGSAGVPARH